MAKIAIIRIRGPVKVLIGIEDTLAMLKISKKNNCRIIEETPSVKGMVAKIKDYVTWGIINDETQKLLDKRKNECGVVKLNSPRGGFERKGIKIPFLKGGALGDRKEKINELIRKMI